MRREQTEFPRGMGDLRMYAPSRFTFDDVNLKFIEESPEKQEYIECWVQQVFERRQNNTTDDRRKIKLISLEPKNAFSLNIFDVRIYSAEVRYYPEINQNLKITSNVFVRKVLFEKIGNPILEIEFSLTLRMEKFNIDYF